LTINNVFNRTAIKDYLIDRRSKLRLSNSKGVNSTSYHFNELLISFLHCEKDTIDQRNDALSSIALRTLRFAGNNPSIDDIVRSFKEDSSVQMLAENIGASEKEITDYIQENSRTLKNTHYLALRSTIN
jgi:hypothetical protein